MLFLSYFAQKRFKKIFRVKTSTKTTMFVESEVREKAYKFVAYSAVTFSLAAIVAVFITLPMVNNYVNSVHARVQHEMEFCKVRKIANISKI